MPKFFGVPEFGNFVIPNDIAKLLARLHNLNSNARCVELEHNSETDFNELSNSFERFHHFVRENPDWINKNFNQSFNKEDKEGSSEFSKLQSLSNLDQLKDGEPNNKPDDTNQQVNLIEKYGLEFVYDASEVDF